MEFQVCSKCKKRLSLGTFNKTKITSKNKLGRQHYCKKCQLKYSQENPEKWKMYREKVSSEQTRKFKLKHKYNITIEDYDRMFEEQHGYCAVCGKSEIEKHQSGTILRLAVDHNHKTGKIRRLVCRSCNLMLGNAKEDINILVKAIEYLKRY